MTNSLTSSSAATSTSAYTGPSEYTTTETSTVASHSQSAYPSVDASTCGSWTLVDNVCCPLYCSNQNESSSCDSTCTGECVTPSSADCKSGTMWGETLHVTDDEDWHYSVSFPPCISLPKNKKIGTPIFCIFWWTGLESNT